MVIKHRPIIISQGTLRLLNTLPAKGHPACWYPTSLLSSKHVQQNVSWVKSADSFSPQNGINNMQPTRHQSFEGLTIAYNTLTACNKCSIRKASRTTKRICWVSPAFRAEHPRAAGAVDAAPFPPWTVIFDKQAFLETCHHRTAATYPE